MAKEKKIKKGDIDFLFEVGSLRNVQRTWRQHVGFDCANVLDHTVRVAWLALLIARKEGVADEEKILKMALVHDIAETRVSDHAYVHKIYVKADEDKAARDMFKGTSFSDFYSDVLKEYEERKTIEAKIVKDADNLDVDLELKEFEEQGSKLPQKWQKLRKEVVYEEKLYTKAAKEIWKVLQKSDPADWHINKNKWLEMPNAGK